MREDHDVQQTWEGDNNVLIQQTARYLIQLLNSKFGGKNKKTQFCDWVTVEPTNEMHSKAKTHEDLMNIDILIEAMEYRANYVSLLLMSSSSKFQDFLFKRKSGKVLQ